MHWSTGISISFKNRQPNNHIHFGIGRRAEMVFGGKKEMLWTPQISNSLSSFRKLLPMIRALKVITLLSVWWRTDWLGLAFTVHPKLPFKCFLYNNDWAWVCFSPASVSLQPRPGSLWGNAQAFSSSDILLTGNIFHYGWREDKQSKRWRRNPWAFSHFFLPRPHFACTTIYL